MEQWNDMWKALFPSDGVEDVKPPDESCSLWLLYNRTCTYLGREG